MTNPIKIVQMRWTADQVREAARSSKKPLVLRRGDNYQNLSYRRALRFEGVFNVVESPYEIVVTDNGRTKWAEFR